ncbi:capsid protein [Clostridium sp. HMP27]|nr:capsid protein [Clostridium sp. HMP27]
MTKEVGLQPIKKDISLSMPSAASQQFLVDTINKAGTLPKLNPIYKNDAAGNIDTLTVSSRRIREHSKDHKPDGVNSIGQGKIPYAVKKVFWDEWIQDDDVWYNMQVRGENVETTIINLIQGQLAVDLQDLIFNGDISTPDSDPDKDFLRIIDGFVKRMKKSPYKTDLLDKEPQLMDFINHVQLLPEKYKNKFDDITWFITRNTHDKLMAQVSQRATGFGDAVLQDGKLTRLAGYPIEIVASLQSKFAALTPIQNLKPVFTRQLRYNRTGVGATAAAKDATYHIIFAYLDAVLRDVNAVAWMTGNKL